MNNKMRSTLFYLASVCFYIVAVIHFWNKDTSAGVVWMALGSAFLCFGGMTLGKDPDAKDKKDRDKK